MKKVITVVILLTVVLTSCIKDTNTSCSFNDSPIIAPVSEVSDLQTYLTSQGITATQHSSGFFYKINTTGTGTAVSNLCTSVSVKYKGKFVNGNIFDSTVTGTPAFFQLGRVIVGWQKGMPLISKGGTITLYIPPSLGYGANDVKNQSTGAVIIPGNSKLIFDIELLDVVNQ